MTPVSTSDCMKKKKHGQQQSQQWANKQVSKTCILFFGQQGLLTLVAKRLKTVDFQYKTWYTMYTATND